MRYFDDGESEIDTNAAEVSRANPNGSRGALTFAINLQRQLC
jgi:hypothetical protein